MVLHIGLPQYPPVVFRYRKLRKNGGIAILKGNLAPDGCVVKRSAVAENMMKHKGNAKVFDNEESGYEVKDYEIIRSIDNPYLEPNRQKGVPLPLLLLSLQSVLLLQEKISYPHAP